MKHKTNKVFVAHNLKVVSLCLTLSFPQYCSFSRDTSRPSSAASNLSTSSEWSVIEPSSCDLLQFEVDIKFNIPDIVIAPTLSTLQSAVNDVAVALVNICQDMQWWAVDTKETLHTSISNNTDITSLVQAISDIVTSKLIICSVQNGWKGMIQGRVVGYR